MASREIADAGPRFDRPVPPGGYAWWYVDAWSDDGTRGLTIIAFVGSVFSPYYAFARRRGNGVADPENHCAINVALYGPNGRWAMTERGRRSVTREENRFVVGPSDLVWDGKTLTIRFDEVCAPIPKRLKGMVRVTPGPVLKTAFAIDGAGRHEWRPISPACRVEVTCEAPRLGWSGDGYLDFNAGSEPLEAAFRSWTWGCATGRDGARILYDVELRDEADPMRSTSAVMPGGAGYPRLGLASPSKVVDARDKPGHDGGSGRAGGASNRRLSLALHVGRDGTLSSFDAPPHAALAKPLWRMERPVRCDAGVAPGIAQTLEDAPFYARTRVATRLCGEDVVQMHESLSLERFTMPVVQAMLPFRMPRRA